MAKKKKPVAKDSKKGKRPSPKKELKKAQTLMVHVNLRSPKF
jgi:hypothetical protein